MAVRYYFGVAEPSEEGWWISFPAIPGVVSAGKDWTELMDNARDALLSAFETMEDDGETLPPDAIADPSSASFDPADYQDGRAVMVAVPRGGESLQVDLDADLLAHLDEIAERTHSTRAALLRRGAELIVAAGGGAL